MAPKKGKSVDVSGNLNINLLSQIASGQVTRINQADSMPFLAHTPQLIEVNTQDIVDGMAACRVTPEGKAMVDATNTNGAASGEATSSFAIINNVVLPPRKRTGRGSGAPSQYPFDSLEIGQGFFVPKSAKHPNPVKTLASTISQQNMKNAIATGETKQVEITKRGPGNKAVLDPAGNKVKETVTRPVMKAVKKFAMRSVKQGEGIGGGQVADADGVIISRVALD